MAKTVKKPTSKVSPAKRDTTNYSVLKAGGQVPTRKIDSMKRANPNLGRVIGKPSTGSGGMKTYGDNASDAIKAGLKGKRK